MARLVYRGGSATIVSLTPRAGKDTMGRPGQAPGLSVFDSLERAARLGARVIQVIDLDLLEPPLRAFPDDVVSAARRDTSRLPRRPRPARSILFGLRSGLDGG